MMETIIIVIKQTKIHLETERLSDSVTINLRTARRFIFINEFCLRLS